MGQPLKAAPDPVPGAFGTDEARWRAVVARDAAADDAFVYSVRTTGVFCRPSCKARPARRENVAFHADPAAARKAGFRACKRCRPEEPSREVREAATIARACARITEAETPVILDVLAAESGMSPFHFHRVFKRVTGVTPRAYAAAQRARRLSDGLGTADSVTAAVYDAGYGSSGRFYETAGERLGMTPTAWRKGGAGETIRYGFGRSSLGQVLVAATARGICAILIGDDKEALAADLAQRFPHAALARGDGDFSATVQTAITAVDRPATAEALPLDVRGTAFQERVWQELRRVPAGVTLTYAELARRIGKPSATRAVASACGANPVAVVIPCHRIVRGDGGLGGYRWGLEHKKALLAREKK